MQPVTMDAVAMSTRDSRQTDSETQWYEPGGPGRAFFGVLGRPRTYLGFVYTLAVAFALGVTWFTVLVTLIAVGTSLTITLVGIPILVFTLYAWGWMAELERVASNSLLGTSIPPIRYNQPSKPGWWSALKARLASTVTWRSFVFVFLVRFVQGTVVFALAVTFISIPLGFLTAPLVAEIGSGVDLLFWRIENWYTGLIFAIAGIPALALAAHANNGIAWLSARLTEAFLTTPETYPAPSQSYAAPAPAAPIAPAAATSPATPTAAPAAPAPATPPSIASAAAATEPARPPGVMASVSTQTNEVLDQLKVATREISGQAKSAWTDFEQRTSAAVKAWNQPAAVTPPAESPETASPAAPAESASDPQPPTTLEARDLPLEPEAPAATTPTETTFSASSGGEPPSEPLDADTAPADRLPIVEVDVVARIVRIDGRELEVTRREFDLLALFAANPGRAFSREELLDRIWKNEYDITDRTIDTHVQRLRKKLGAAAESIQTVWGVGYRFAPPSSDD